MQVSLDDAVLVQTLGSQLRFPHNILSKASAGVVTITQDPALERTPDDMRTYITVRADPWPRITRRPRPRSPTIKPRTPWICGHGKPTLMRRDQINRRQIRGRLRGLSPSISSGPYLAADRWYKSLLQEALLLGATAGVSEEPTPRFQGDFVPSIVTHEFWSQEEWDIRHLRATPELDSLEREDPAMMPYLEIGKVDTLEDSNDALSDGIDQWEEDRLRLDPNHRFWRVKNSLVQHAQARFAQSYQFMQQEPRKKETPVFACPFFRKDPALYWLCLADTSMATIREVKQHLWRHHSQPYYCPVCYDIFPLASERDIHIMKRICEKRDMLRFDGMTPEQKTLIASKCKGCSGPDQWRRIWKVLFGQPPKMLEPFLSPGLSSKIMLVAGFWKAKGKEITEQFLDNMGTAEECLSSRGCDDKAISGLVNVVLQDLVGLAFWRSALGRNVGIIPSLELAI